MIGDAGNAPLGESPYHFSLISEMLNDASGSSSVVFLGDNIYPVGLPPEDHPDYPLGLHRLTAQTQLMQAYQGNVFFIPGNHDWYSYGVDGILRQEALIEGHLRNFSGLQNDNFFLPDHGCPDPVMVELCDDINMLTFDSYWYLSGQSQSPGRDDCRIASDAQLFSDIRELVQQRPGKTIIVAMHHPLFSGGEHGGYHSFKNNFFPLTQLVDYLYLPLPVSGFIAMKMRSYLTPQDVNHKRARRLRDFLVRLAEEHGQMIFAAGHEHNLQFLRYRDIPFIISGSGSKITGVRLTRESKFGVGAHGLAMVTMFSDGTKEVHFYIFDPDKKNLKHVFSESM